MFNPRRTSIVGSILFFYLLPIFLMSWYGMNRMTGNDSWRFFTIGVVIAFFGSLILYMLMCRKEKEEKKEHDQPLIPEQIQTGPSPQEQTLTESLTELQHKHEQVLSELTQVQAALEVFRQDKETYQVEALKEKQEFENYKLAIEAQIQRKDELLEESQQATREQRLLNEKHLQHIAALENKERDLHYELKTLLQLTNIDHLTTPVETAKGDKKGQEYLPSEEPSRVSDADTAQIQLKRCLDIATKMPGANFGQETARFRDFSMDSSALDLRRLFDTLKDETGAIVVVYSQKENKMLFVNSEVKDVLGWTPEKFVNVFPEIVQEGHEEWQRGIGQLSISPEVQFTVPMKTKTGNNVMLHSHFGTIYMGPFRHHAIGVLFESEVVA